MTPTAAMRALYRLALAFSVLCAMLFVCLLSGYGRSVEVLTTTGDQRRCFLCIPYARETVPQEGAEALRTVALAAPELKHRWVTVTWSPEDAEDRPQADCSCAYQELVAWLAIDPVIARALQEELGSHLIATRKCYFSPAERMFGRFSDEPIELGANGFCVRPGWVRCREVQGWLLKHESFQRYLREDDASQEVTSGRGASTAARGGPGSPTGSASPAADIPFAARLIEVLRKGDEGKAASMLTAITDVQRADEVGWTPLHWAVLLDGDSALAQLVERGADPNAANIGELRALHLAAGLGSTGKVSLLIAAGADVNARAPQGWTPLFFSVAAGYAPASSVLLDAGASPNGADAAGRTPLYWALLRGYSGDDRLVALLLDHGANPNVTDADGNSALAIATKRGYEGLVKLLKQHGAKD